MHIGPRTGLGFSKYLTQCFDLSDQVEKCDWLTIWLESKLTYYWKLQPRYTWLYMTITSELWPLPSSTCVPKQSQCKSQKQVDYPTIWSLIYSNMELGSGWQYGGPCLSGHSQQRPPFLMWPQLFGACIYFSLSPKATSLMWPQFLGK